MVRQLLEVALLLGELLLQLQQLFALTPADGVVLVGLLALLEGVTVCIEFASTLASSSSSSSSHYYSSSSSNSSSFLPIGGLHPMLRPIIVSLSLFLRTLGRRSWAGRRCRRPTWRGRWS